MPRLLILSQREGSRQLSHSALAKICSNELPHPPFVATSKVVKGRCAGQTFNHDEPCNVPEASARQVQHCKLEQSVQIIFSSSQSPFLSHRRFHATSPVWVY
jgi:hypothetical protein